MLPMFLAMVDATIVAAALPAIAGSLGDVDRISWIVVSYLVSATIAAPVYGRLGDLMGRRRLMFVALAMSITASVLCALSTSVMMLVAARVLQGTGGGGLMTLAQALIGEAVPPRDRGRYQGYLAAIGVSSSIFGPVAGGFLTQYLGWQSVFLVNIPIGLAAVLLLLRLPDRGGSGEPVRFDFLGLVLFASFIASLLVMLQQVRTIRATDLLVPGGLLAISLASILLLIWREKRASDPLLPIPLLRNPSIWRCNALTACHGAVLVSLITFLPIYLRVVHGAPAAQIGLLMLPMMAGVAVGSMIIGRIVSRTGRTAIFPTIGMPIVTGLLIAIAFWSTTASAESLSAALGVTAVFMGTVMAVVQVTVQVAAGPNMLGTAAASVQFSRSLGAALGTAAVGAVLFAVLTMENQETAMLFSEILQRGPEMLQILPAAERAAIASEIGSAFRAAFLTVAGFGVLATFLAWTIPMRRI
jgi:EmrB/QacA subfamily drug resistance transporter